MLIMKTLLVTAFLLGICRANRTDVLLRNLRALITATKSSLEAEVAILKSDVSTLSEEIETRTCSCKHPQKPTVKPNKGQYATQNTATETLIADIGSLKTEFEILKNGFQAQKKSCYSRYISLVSRSETVPVERPDGNWQDLQNDIQSNGDRIASFKSELNITTDSINRIEKALSGQRADVKLLTNFRTQVQEVNREITELRQMLTQQQSESGRHVERLEEELREQKRQISELSTLVQKLPGRKPGRRPGIVPHRRPPPRQRGSDREHLRW